MQTNMMNTQMTPESMVDGIINLVSLPEICFRINEVMNNPNHDINQLADVISHDPSLTARILRIVNSAYYSFPGKIDRVSRAVSVIGEDDLRSLVLATSAISVFKKVPNELVDLDQFWGHSVHCGIVSRLLAKECNILHGERLFVAGVLHDIGKLIMYFQEPELSQRVLLDAGDNEGDLVRAESRIIGFTHADVGGALIDAWGLPQSFHEAVCLHHTPTEAKEYVLETAIIHTANCIVNALAPDIPLDEHLLEDVPDFDVRAMDIIGIDTQILPSLVDYAWVQTQDIMNIICPAA